MAILYLFIGKQIITVNTFKVRKSVQNFQFILFSYYISLNFILFTVNMIIMQGVWSG